MALSECCQDRLAGWKFGQAVLVLHEEQPTDEEEEIVRALACVFGDIGAFDGDLNLIVHAAVRSLLTLPKYTEPPEPAEGPGYVGEAPSDRPRLREAHP